MQGIGVLAPADPDQAAALLPVPAQECTIVLGIEHLFRLVKEQFAKVLDVVGSAVLLVNQQGNLVYVNSAAEAMLGSDGKDLIGHCTTDLGGPWSRILATRPQRLTTGHLDRFGLGAGERWVDWQISPMRSGAVVAGWLVMAKDRTDYRRWQLAAREAERMATTATMVDALAHELRNPLASAKGVLQLLGRRRDPAKVAGYKSLIVRELDRVTRLLNEFLLLGKPAHMAPESLDLVAFLEELLPLMEGEAPDGVAIEVDLRPVAHVEADMGQLTQVVFNLVRNAIQAVGERGRVVLALRQAPGGVALSVRDTGPGLSPQVTENLFRPFFTTKERGTGLGLAVTQAIVHNHRGRITAVNSAEGGAVFALRKAGLRTVSAAAGLCRPDWPGCRDADGNRCSAALSCRAWGGVPMARVLIIEDEPTVAMVLREALADEGHEATTAPDGVSGLARLGQPPAPEIVLVDLFMPGLGGRDLVQAMRSDPELDHIPVVLVTGAVLRPEDLPPGGTYQAVVVKPFELAEVLETVEALLDHGIGGPGCKRRT